MGLSLKDDFHQLSQRRPDFTPRGCIDLQQIAAEMGIEDMSLAKLFANFFRRRISKTAQLTNWEADVLDEKQRLYAATDADACIRLYERMVQLQASHDFVLLPAPPKPEPPESAAPMASSALRATTKTRKTATKRTSKATTSPSRSKKKSSTTAKSKTTARKRTTSRRQSPKDAPTL